MSVGGSERRQGGQALYSPEASGCNGANLGAASSESSSFDETRRASIQTPGARIHLYHVCQEIEAGQASLQQENSLLRKRLDDALQENLNLKRMMTEQQQVTVEQNRALQRLLERMNQLSQENQHGLVARELPNLVRPARFARNPLSSQHQHIGSAPSVLKAGRGAIQSENNRKVLRNTKECQPPRFGCNPFSESRLMPRLPVLTSGQQVMRAHGYSSGTNAQDRIPADIKIQYLQQELEALKKNLHS